MRSLMLDFDGSTPKWRVHKRQANLAGLRCELRHSESDLKAHRSALSYELLLPSIDSPFELQYIEGLVHNIGCELAKLMYT